MAFNYWVWRNGRPIRGGALGLCAPVEYLSRPAVLEAIQQQLGETVPSFGVGGTVDAEGGIALVRDPYGDHAREAAQRLGWAD